MAALGKKVRPESLMVVGEIGSPGASVTSMEIGSLQRPSRDGFELTPLEGEQVALTGKERAQFALAGLSGQKGTVSDASLVSAEELVPSATSVDSSAEIDQKVPGSLPQSLSLSRREKLTVQHRRGASRGDAPQDLTPKEDAQNLSDRTGNQIPILQAMAAPVAVGSTEQELHVSAEPTSRDFGSRSKRPVFADGLAHQMSQRDAFSSSPATKLGGESKNSSTPSSESPGGTDLAPTASMNGGEAVLAGGATSRTKQSPSTGVAPASALTDRLTVEDAHERSDGFETFHSIVPPVGVALNIERANTTGQTFVESTSFAPVVIPNETMVSGMGNGFPLLRSEKLPTQRGAKIAAASVASLNGEKSGELESIKTFLKPIEQEVASYAEPVGTSVAKSKGVMPTAAIPTHPIASDSSNSASVWNETLSPALERTAAVDTMMLSPESTDSAHRAVEAVLTAADRVSSGGRQSVNLHFSVGGADLNVRVEMRADQVHATFRTDSPELRSALANEWQSVNSAINGENSMRLAPPVFTTNANLSNSSNPSSFAGGDGSSRQRDSRANQSQDDTFELGTSASSGRARFVRTVSSGDSILPATSGGERTVSPTLTRRLQTHA
jgi:hypothetical protein